VPPSHRAVVACHKGRAFAAGEATYADGHVLPRFNQATMAGVGTAWPASLAGRWLYVAGATQAYPIAAVDPVNQVLTLATPYFERPAPYAAYAIRPAPGQRKLLYYSEPALPDAWPITNAVALPEDDDDVTGLMVRGQFLYVLQRRHVYYLAYEEDPGRDGFVFLVAHRGCLNARCWARADGDVYLLDEAGIWKFDGEGSEAASTPIQDLFLPDGEGPLRVDWAADQRTWHAAADPLRDTIRWFVAFVGDGGVPRHAIGLDYRSGRWWVEAYPAAMTASAAATVPTGGSCPPLAGARRSLAGTVARRVVCLGEGTYDGISGAGTTAGSATAADAISLTDATASFDDLEGAPIAIVAGTGAGQLRRVAGNSATRIEVVRPWDTIPDATSAYRVGGIPWTWAGGWHELVPDERDNARDVALVYTPTAVPTLVDLQLGFDHEPAARTWALDRASDQVVTRAGSPDITFDLDTPKGYAVQRLAGHADPYAHPDRFVRVQLSGVAAGAPVRIHQITISGAESP
jgi:hypothetical protein